MTSFGPASSLSDEIEELMHRFHGLKVEDAAYARCCIRLVCFALTATQFLMPTYVSNPKVSFPQLVSLVIMSAPVESCIPRWHQSPSSLRHQLLPHHRSWIFWQLATSLAHFVWRCNTSPFLRTTTVSQFLWFIMLAANLKQSMQI